MRKLLVLLVLLMLPAAQAQFGSSIPYDGELDYTQSLGSLPAFISGAVEYSGNQAQNATMLLGTGGVTITGLDRLCWEKSSGASECHAGTGLSVELEDGGSMAFRTPKTYDVALEAGHALAFFADSSKMFGEGRDEILELGESMVAFPTDEDITISDVATLPPPTKPFYTSFNDALRELALVMTLSDDSTLVLRQGATTLDTLSGNSRWVGFQGNPEFTSITADLAVIPMPNGAVAEFTRASNADAREGLGAENLNAAFGSLQESEGEGDANSLSGIGDAAEALAGFLNGAVIHVESGAPGEEQTAADLLASMTLIRFQEMDASRSDSAVALDGAAALQIEDGEVAGAQPLIGGIMPVWGIILGGLAVALFVIRVVMKAPKENRFWDKLHWIGKLAAIGTGILVFFLWDLQMASLWGTSLLTSGAKGTTLGVIAALQLIPLLLASLFFGFPAKSIINSGARIAGQGRMMNMGAILAPFIVLFLGGPLVLALLDTILQMVSSSGA